MSTSLHGGPVSLILWTSGREPRGCWLTAVLWARVGRPSLAPFRSSPLSHALVPHPPVFLLLQSSPHAVLLPAPLSRPLRPSRRGQDAVPWEGPRTTTWGSGFLRRGWVPSLQSRLEGSMSQLGQGVSTPASSTSRALTQGPVCIAV